MEGTFSGPGPRFPHVFTDPRTRGCASAQSDAGPPASKRGGADSRAKASRAPQPAGAAGANALAEKYWTMGAL